MTFNSHSSSGGASSSLDPLTSGAVPQSSGRTVKFESRRSDEASESSVYADMDDGAMLEDEEDRPDDGKKGLWTPCVP